MLISSMQLCMCSTIVEIKINISAAMPRLLFIERGEKQRESDDDVDTTHIL